jgi:hypothetical protein
MPFKVMSDLFNTSITYLLEIGAFILEIYFLEIGKYEFFK